jgi:hypothetical protein
MTDANLGAVKLLLGSGAEVLDNGHQGLTVLMKPLLSEEAAIIHYSHRGEDDRKKADEKVRLCLVSVLDAVLRCGVEQMIMLLTLEAVVGTEAEGKTMRSQLQSGYG